MQGIFHWWSNATLQTSQTPDIIEMSSFTECVWYLVFSVWRSTDLTGYPVCETKHKIQNTKHKFTE